MAKHRVVGQLLYTLPFGPGCPLLSALRGVPGALLAGWTLSSVLIAQTGSWSTPSSSGYDVSNTNTIGGRPDRIGSGVLPAGERTIYRWFDASALRLPGDSNGDGRPDVQVGRFSNCGVGILTGPGNFVLNAGVHKKFGLTQRARMVLQFTLTNAPNHVNYSNPSSSISSTASVGSITSAGTARTSRLGMRIEF
jgi:hypothetical protein